MNKCKTENSSKEQKPSQENQNEPKQTCEEKDTINEIEKIQNDLEEQKEKFLRIVAEYDNYRKRSQRDRIASYNDAISDAVTEFLPLADNFELALSSVQNSSNEEYTKGIQMLQKQFEESLKKLNVQNFGESGESFNPNIHNAVAHVQDENFEENVIIEIFRKGYMIGDKVIRHAMVKVAN